MPIVRIVDLETTGMEPPAQVCEYAHIDFDTDTRDLFGIDGRAVSRLHFVDVMPPECRAVHHISQDETVGCPRFDCLAVSAEAKADGVWGFAAHNAEFEGKWIVSDLPVICTYKAALRVWPEAPSHSNWALFYWLLDQGLVDGGVRGFPHRAGPDVAVTSKLLGALLDKTTGAQMVAWTKEPRLLPTCPIGKFRGKPWDQVEFGFLDWMLKQTDMEADLKWNAARELDRRRQE
jgi:exodeoxyribonuclease X